MSSSEAFTRKTRIDAALTATGWQPIVAYSAAPARNLAALTEHPTASGPVDYALFQGSEPLALVEAKRDSIDSHNALVQAQRYARDYFWAAASQAVNLASINATKLRMFPIPLPPPVEKKRILARIEALFAQVEAIETAVAVARRRVEQMEPAILNRAFRGQLVPPEPAIDS